MLLGGFDGLHTGYRALLARAKEYRLPVGVMTIVGAKGQQLFTFAEREEIFRRAGVDFAVELPFEQIRQMSPREFLRLLEEQFAPTAFVCGEDFRFGKGAEGTAKDLHTMTAASVIVLPLLEEGGKKVSASTVKERIVAGELPEANRLLGEPFFLTGTVVTGKKLGRTIGFPTANLMYPDEKIALSYGVYETRVSVDGKEYPSITNFGAQPTFDGGRVCVESYLDGFSGDLYGCVLTVRFVRFLRPIQRFESVEALKQQLASDLQAIRGNQNGD